MTLPQSYLGYRDNDLFFGRHRVADLVADYKGPTYFYDLAIVEDRFRKMRAALGDAEIFYAMKANGHRSILSKLKSAGSGADVVSAGEIRAALEAGFVPRDIIYSGVGKTIADIEFALKTGIHQINVESLPELERIATVARRLGQRASVVLRLNPNIDVKTHPYIATGLQENKFGIELEMLPKVIEVLSRNSETLEPAGISLHLGSLMTELSGFRQALGFIKGVYQELQTKFPSVARFDVGGGLGIIYDRDAVPHEEMLLKEYADIIRRELKDVRGQIQTEPGRWLLGHAGILATQIQYVKPTRHKNFLIVDSGMNHLIRPALYQSYHSIWTLQKYGDRPRMNYDVVGPICESSDFFAKNRDLPECRQDEILILGGAGAYGFSMASTYNRHDLPREICL